MISVIIPVYNVEDYLNVCLNSVLKQTYGNFEIICIDDASTDSSFEILEYFSKKDSRIKVFKNDSNMGPGYSRNRGLDIAEGKYISFLDGDDWLSPNAFEILIEKAEQDNLDLLMFKNIVYYEEPHNFGMEEYYDMKFMNEFENKVFNHFDLDKTKVFKISNAAWNKFYLKSFLDDNNIRFPNENLIHEDNPFFFKVITRARRISLIDNYLHNRRRRPNSIMTLNNERLLDNIDICYLVLDGFLENYQLYLYYKKEILTYVFANVLNAKYEQIDAQFKEEFFRQVQEVYKNFITDYDLYEDILEYVDKSILDKFKFDEIIEWINHNPKMSVIIPVFNVEKYIRECLNSVVNQNFVDMEIICVNDGSTDGSLTILKEYWRHDSRFTIISQENKGLAAARNMGLRQAKGEYVYFIDSDDYIEFNALNEIYTLSEEKNLDMILFKLISFWDDTKEKYATPYLEMEFLNELVGDNVFNYKDLGNKVYDLAVTIPGALFKRNLISDLNFPEGLIFEDNVFFIESVFKAKRILFYNKHLYNYRTRKQSITNSGANFSDIIEIRNRIIDLAIKYDNFNSYLFSKKFSLIVYRFLQVSEENKADFFNKIQKDFTEHKGEYESSEEFKNLPEKDKSIFYAGLNAENYKEFEELISGKIAISVIIPVYNKQKHIYETLQSIENQTLKNIEVICIDDGSTDNSVEVIKNFNSSFRLKIFKQNNLGPGMARNNGLEKSNGEYVSFLDADDLFEDSKALEEMYELAKSSNAIMVSANLNRGDTKDIRYKSYYTKFYEKEMVIKPDDYEVPFYFGKNIFKNSFLRENKITFPDLEMGEDPVFLAEILSRIDEIPCLPVDFYYYRISETPAIDKIDAPQKKRDYIKHFKDTLTILKDAGYTKMFDNYIDLLVEYISHPNYNSDLDVYDAFCSEFGDFPEIFDKYINVFSISEDVE